MPRIPIYGEQQVSTTGLPSVPQGQRISQQDALAYAGAQDSVALANATGAMADAALQVQDIDDKARVVEQSGVLSLAAATHHANLSKMTGADASKIVQTNEEFWKKFESESTAGMTPRQRAMFEPTLARMKAGSFESAIREQTKGVDEYLNLTLLGTQSSAAAAARENPTNPELLLEQSKIYKGALAAQVDRMKLEGPAKDAYVRDQMAKFHEPIISKLMETDSHAAIGYYNTHIKEISVDRREKIEHDLKTGGMAQYAQEEVDAAVAQFGGYTQEAYDYLIKKNSGDHEEAVTREFMGRKSNVDGIANDTRKQTVYELIQQTGKAGWHTANTVRRTAAYMGLDAEGKTNYDEYVKARQREAKSEYRSDLNFAQSQADRKQAKAKEKAQDIKDNNYARYSAALDANPQADIDFYGKYGELSAAQIDVLVERQRRYKSGDNKELTDAAVRQTTTRLARTAGVNDKFLWGLHDMVAKEIQAEAQLTGRPVDVKRVEAIVNEGLRKGHTEGMFGWNNNTRLYNVKPEERSSFIPKEKTGGAALLSQVPPADRAEIERELRAAGVKVTTDSVLKYYNEANGK